jgi:hypothetical protein
MLVKYRMLPTISNANFKADIIGILDGTITSTAGLSAGADTTNSSFVGTYPSSQLTKVNAGTYTFSKIHGTDNTYTHYFRLTFDAGVGLAAKMTTFTVAQGYTSGTDTLLNSVAQTVNVSPNTYISASQYPSGINIVLTSKCVWISSLTSGKSFGIFDLGANGITSTYATNMRMAYVNTTLGTFNIPYGYVLSGGASGYTSLTGNLSGPTTPTLMSNISGSAIIVENPAFASAATQGFAAYGVGNLFKLGSNMMAMDSIYNTSGTRRIVAAADYAIVTE